MKRLYLIFTFILAFWAYLPVANSQAVDNEKFINRLYDNEIEQYFSFELNDPSLLSEIGRDISIDKVEKSGKVYAYANRQGFTHFLNYGISYRILPHPGDFNGYVKMLDHVNAREITDWDFYPTYDAYIEMMNQFAANFPSLCQIVTIGTSVQGRQIIAARISDNVGMSENEPQFLYTSSIHGDETTGYVLMLRLIDYLLSNYGSDPRITGLVDGIDIFINPLANPDGTYYGGNNSVNGARRFNSNGVDLNRNYPDPEDGQHPDGFPWQIETVHFMNFAEANHFVSSANLHGGEEVCNYPWDTWPRLAADDAWWRYVCHEYADTAHAYAPPDYMSDFDNGITNGYEWYTVSGGRQDYMNFFHQDREFTLEISDTKLLSPNLLPTWWEYSYRSLLNYMEQSMFGLRGTVKDSVTNWPVKAEIYVTLHELDSSWVYSKLPAGNYHRLLYAGTYSVRFSAPGYETKVISNINITNRQATVLDVKLLPNGVGGIDNYLVNNYIRIFPNPVHNELIRFDSEIMVDKVSILDLDGRLIRTVAAGYKSGSAQLQDLPDGTYFIRFDTAKGIGMKKIMVIR